jgi:hypothetical protein
MSNGAFLLSLPAPETIELLDRELADAYRAFCATLSAVSDTALVCDSEFFSGVVEMADGGTIDMPRLKLLAALVCPGRAQMAHIRRRTFAVDDFDRRRGQSTGHTYNQLVVQALRSLKDFAASAECRALRSARRPGQVLGGLDCLFAQAPGIDWHHDLEVSTFGAEWALVLSYDDAEDHQEAAFPSILGFAARADFPWSVAAVLSHDIHGTPPRQSSRRLAGLTLTRASSRSAGVAATTV